MRRPERSDEDDERVLMDELGVGEGKAVLGWNCRGVNMGKVARSNGVGSGAGDRKVVSWGFEGVRRKGEEGTEVEEVELGRVLDPRKMGKVRDDAVSLTLPLIHRRESATDGWSFSFHSYYHRRYNKLRIPPLPPRTLLLPLPLPQCFPSRSP